MASVTHKGTPIDVAGSFPKPGETAPPFTLVGKDLNDVTLDDFAGKRKVLDIVVSLDTGDLCDVGAQVQRDRRRAAQHRGARDLGRPPVRREPLLHDRRSCECRDALDAARGEFLRDYGVKITSGKLVGLAARAVVVLDEKNKVLHSELVPEIAQEPNYDAALAALK